MTDNQKNIEKPLPPIPYKNSENFFFCPHENCVFLYMSNKWRITGPEDEDEYYHQCNAKFTWYNTEYLVENPYTWDEDKKEWVHID